MNINKMKLSVFPKLAGLIVLLLAAGSWLNVAFGQEATINYDLNDGTQFHNEVTFTHPVNPPTHPNGEIEDNYFSKDLRFDPVTLHPERPGADMFRIRINFVKKETGETQRLRVDAKGTGAPFPDTFALRFPGVPTHNTIGPGMFLSSSQGTVEGVAKGRLAVTLVGVSRGAGDGAIPPNPYTVDLSCLIDHCRTGPHFPGNRDLTDNHLSFTGLIIDVTMDTFERCSVSRPNCQGIIFDEFSFAMLAGDITILEPRAFTVNTFSDTIDKNSGDGVCADTFGECSLRAAIEESNALPGFPPEIINLSAGTYFLERGRLEIQESMSIRGVGAAETIIDGQARSSIFFIANPGTNPIVNISGVTIRNGEGGMSSGAGIFISEGSSLNLGSSVVSGNKSRVGGVGITNDGFLALFRSTVRDNEITGGGGGITGVGAGILNGSGRVARIVESTISNNKGIRGGGISNSGRLDIINSTISTNIASVGGGIRNSSSGVVNISFSTITDNEAGLVSGEPPQQRVGGGIVNFGQIDIGNTILAGNKDGRSRSDPLYAPDCFSQEIFRFTSNRGNLVGILNENCIMRDTIFGDVRFDTVGTPESPIDASLESLAHNGGPTQTHALRSNSPAIDEGTGVTSATFFDCPESDQRGLTRPVDGDGNGDADCDVGAFEFGAIPPEIVNDRVSLASEPETSLSTIPTSNGPAGTFFITATFTNTSTIPLRKPFFEVVELSGGNVLINAAGGPRGVGATLIPDVGADGVLSPGESMTAEFRIGLQTQDPFTFSVDVQGEPSP